MAEPTIEMDARTSASSTYSVAIIDGGVVQSGEFRWSDTSSSSGNVTRPSSGNKFADYLFFGTDELVSAAQQPDQTPVTATIKVTTDAVSFDTAPKFTIYDSSSHTEAEEVCVGTTNHTSPLIKGRISTSSTAPSTYWGETDEAALHAKEVAGAVTSGNNGLCGATNYLQASSTDLNTTPEYLWLALSVPDDVSTGVDSIDCVFTLSYTYT
ncbi:MAG: hypothetical protein DRN81_03870 [Thermoproteota archaeon]|nr:MAG: hypothetical protein DRN81_03870 [Candidatus Korarchaeota archaeon]